jgi:hypothetical protein
MLCYTVLAGFWMSIDSRMSKKVRAFLAIPTMVATGG